MKLPHQAPLLIARAEEPRLADALAAQPRPCVLLTDDADLLPALDEGVTVIEPEDVLPDGVSPFEDAWDRGVSSWLDTLFPGALAGAKLSEALWFDVFRQDTLVDRITAFSLATTLLGELSPVSVTVIGETPPHCDAVTTAAHAAGVPIHSDRLAAFGAVMRSLARWPQGAAFAGALMARNAWSLLSRVQQRRRAARDIAPLATASDAPEPRLWVALTSRWRQPSRHLIEAVLGPAGAQRIPYGVAFAVNFGETASAAETDADELSLFDGRVGRHRPARIDQVSGATSLPEALKLLARWLPLSARCVAGCIRHCDQLRVSGVAASHAGDLPGLLRVATHGLLRVMDAEHAARAFVERHPGISTMVLGLASHGEVKVVDLVLQAAGVQTIDYVHGHVGESDLRTTFRSVSTHLCAWSESEAVRFRRLGTNSHVEGGFMPRSRAATVSAPAHPRILIATAYLPKNPEVFRRNFKHARRLARAVSQLMAHLGGRADVVLRPHPFEDRQAWQDLFAGAALPLSDRATLAEDLAASSAVIVTNSSSVVEALAYDLPVLFHRGPITEPLSLVGRASSERCFANGDELIACVERAVFGNDRTPERALRAACFGERGQPAPFLPRLLELDEKRRQAC